jgi:hypothetical protein
MTSSRLQIGSLIVGGCLTLALATGPAMAGTRSAVSLTGSDSGTCPLTAPCRTLAYALTQTGPSGEILIKDSAGFGPITITQAVTIVAPPGVIGFISSPSGDAVTVNAGPNDLVILTGLFLDGLGTGNNGVTVNTVGSISIGGSTITGFTGIGINFVNSSNVFQDLTVSGSSIYRNTGGAALMKPTAGIGLFATFRGTSVAYTGVVIDNTSAVNTEIGVTFDGCVLRNMGVTAVTVKSAGTPNIFVQAHLEKSVVFSNGSTAALIATGAGALIDINNSGAYNLNVLASSSGGGIVGSFGNNAIDVGSLGTLGSSTLH